MRDRSIKNIGAKGGRLTEEGFDATASVDFGLVTAAGLVFSGSAHSQDAAEFYKGKTLTWMVPTGPGGGHDFMRG